MPKKSAKNVQKVKNFSKKAEILEEIKKENIKVNPIPEERKESFVHKITRMVRASKIFSWITEKKYWLFSSQSVLDELNLSEARTEGVIRQKGSHCRFDKVIMWVTDRLVNGLLLFIPVGYFFGYEFSLLLLVALSLGHFIFFDILDQIVKTIKG